MVKIIELSVNEIILEEEACSDLLERACRRNPATPFHVSGICSDMEKVFVILEQCAGSVKLPEYRFAPLSQTNAKAVCSQISARYYAGFTTLGTFMFDNELWALFARDKTGKTEVQE